SKKTCCARKLIRSTSFLLILSCHLHESFYLNVSHLFLNEDFDFARQTTDSDSVVIFVECILARKTRRNSARLELSPRLTKV
ncbi:LOW QUALITY PROTEIN: hypothetical protein HZS_2541, partial [Henneguya salminicola]